MVQSGQVFCLGSRLGAEFAHGLKCLSAVPLGKNRRVKDVAYNTLLVDDKSYATGQQPPTFANAVAFAQLALVVAD